MAHAKRATKTTEQETPEMVDTISGLYAQGIDTFAEIQKKGLDLAVKQNNEIIQSWKKMSIAIPGAPGMMLLELASNAFDRYAHAQEGSMDLVLTQSHALVDVVREGTASTIEVNQISAGLIQRAVEESVSAQKEALDQSAAKTKAAFHKAKTEMGLSGTLVETLAGTLQLGVQHMVENQKELLDFAVGPLRQANQTSQAKTA